MNNYEDKIKLIVVGYARAILQASMRQVACRARQNAAS
jgi:hypothetical protein